METHRTIKTWAEPRDYAPVVQDQLKPVQPYGLADFLFDIRLHPKLAVTCVVGGVLIGVLGVVLPCLIIMAVQS